MIAPIQYSGNGRRCQKMQDTGLEREALVQSSKGEVSAPSNLDYRFGWSNADFMTGRDD